MARNLLIIHNLILWKPILSFRIGLYIIRIR